jgi:uridine kinase
MLVIGIAGGSASGKSTVVRQITKRLSGDPVVIIPQDAYYRDNGHKSREEKLKINFDHPSAIEWSLLIRQLKTLKQGNPVGMPVYTYVTCARSKETITLWPKNIIIVEGILILTNPQLRKLLDIKVFVDADADDRLTRKIRRDIEERGRSLVQVLTHYEQFVKPMHLQFIEPTKRYADIIIPQGGENKIAVDILVSRIKLNM